MLKHIVKSRLVGLGILISITNCHTQNPAPFDAPSSRAIGLDLASYRQPILESLTVKLRNSPRLDIKVCSNRVCKLNVLKSSQHLVEIPLNSESISLRSCRSNRGKSCGKWQTFSLFEESKSENSGDNENRKTTAKTVRSRPPLAKLFKSLQKSNSDHNAESLSKPFAVKLEIDQARLEISAHIR